MKLKDNSPKEIDTALYQLEQKLNNKINNIEFPEQKVYDDKDIRAALETEISDRKAALKQEADDRKTNDSNLQANINTEVENREKADNNLQANIDAKQNKLIAGDNITITDDKISATDTTYTASSPIKVSGTDIQLDVVPVDKGGTGKTTAKNAFMNLAEGLDESSGPLDTESIIYRNTTGSNWGRYTLATFWGWIKSKIENVFSSLISHPSDTTNPHSVTKAQVGLGNCDNTADKDKNVNSAQYVIDSANTNKIIEIAYANTGLTSSTATHFVAFGAPEHSGTEKTIRDISVAEAKKLLGVNNVNNTADSDKSVNYATSAGSATSSGNATTATKLATARSISITDGTNTGTTSTFDGSSNISLQLPSAYNGFIQNKWTRTNCVELGYSRGENITDLQGFFTKLYNRYGQYINLYFDWADACCANLVVNNTTIILNDTLFFGKIQEMQGDWQSSNIFISSYSSGACYNLLLNCHGTTTIQATLRKLTTDNTNNTFSATNNFSGTLVIPTTSSTTNGAIWIG